MRDIALQRSVWENCVHVIIKPLGWPTYDEKIMYIKAYMLETYGILF